MPDLTDHIRWLDRAIREHGEHQTRVAQLWKDFSADVRKRRLAKGLILKQVAYMTGIGQGTLFYLEHGKREWTLEKARLVAKALK